MRSYTSLRNMFGQLSLNNSATNLTNYDQLMNDSHRYLLQKYFSNETTYQMLTAGGSTKTLTATPAIGDTSATLTSAWTGNTTKIQVTFSSGEIRMVQVESGLTGINWTAPLTAVATTSITVGANQFYPAPPNYSKLKTVTINVGGLVWPVTEVLTTQAWNQMNMLPYYADIPLYFFVYPGSDRNAQIGIWPIPSSTGNVITYAYKYRVPDLSIADYTTGTVNVNKGSTTVTGSGTTWTATSNFQNESRWIQISPTGGDNMWYQIASIDSTTSLTLYQPYQGVNVSGGSYTIGQMPLLMEDFHDMLYYYPLYIYYSSTNKDIEKARVFKGIYDEKLLLMEEYAGSNTVDVNLGHRPLLMNPNLFPQNIGGTP